MRKQFRRCLTKHRLGFQLLSRTIGVVFWSAVVNKTPFIHANCIYRVNAAPKNSSTIFSTACPQPVRHLLQRMADVQPPQRAQLHHPLVLQVQCVQVLGLDMIRLDRSFL